MEQTQQPAAAGADQVPDPRFPFGYRLERVKRRLKNGEEREYFSKRPLAAPRPRGKQQVRNAVLAMTAAEAEQLATRAAEIMKQRELPAGEVSLDQLVRAVAALAPDERIMVLDMLQRMTPSPVVSDTDDDEEAAE